MNRGDQRSWISAKAFAQLAGISNQKARRALARASLGNTWRGSHLTIRWVHARGGRAGTQYEVYVPSLSPELRAQYECRGVAVTERAAQLLLTHEASNGGVEKRKAILAPAIEAFLRGEDYEPFLVRIAAQPDMPTLETLQRQMRGYVDHGDNGLRRKRRSDFDVQKVVISGPCDTFIRAILPEEKLHELGHACRVQSKSAWAKGAPSAAHAARIVSTQLVELLRNAGVAITDAEAARVCKVPRHFVERDRHNGKLIAVRDKDAKRFNDRHAPRIMRHWDNMTPMECVSCDVHRVDIFFQRPDGSLATPRLIAWQDTATRVVHADVCFFGPREDVRKKHVIWSFLNLVKKLGMPSAIYQDNGKEFNCTELADDALRCASLLGKELRIYAPPMKAGVTKARPYQGQAKGIESLFAALEGGAFAMFDNHIGGDRTTKKTHNVGKKPLPYPGPPEHFADALQTAIEYYNSHPQTGRHLRGRSPNEAWNEAVRNGHMKVEADTHLLGAAFSEKKSVKVDRGVFRLNGRRYYHDELLRLSGLSIEILAPEYRPVDLIAVLDPDRRQTGREVLCFAAPEQAFAFGDFEGARERSRRHRRLESDIRESRKDVVPLDLVEEMEKAVALKPARLDPPVGATLWISEALQETAHEIAALPAPGEARRVSADERERKQTEMLKMFERSKAARTAKVSGA